MSIEFNSKLYKSFMAEKVHLYAQTVLPVQLANNMETHIRSAQHSMEILVAQVSTWCTAGRVEDRVEDRIEKETIHYPLNTWEHFKEDYLPN